MNIPSSRYVCSPLRTQLPVVSNSEFIRAWMARRAAAAKVAAAVAVNVKGDARTPASLRRKKALAERVPPRAR